MEERFDFHQVMEGMKEQFGMDFAEVRNGYVKAFVPTGQEHLNFMGIVYGGWIFHIADMTSGIAFLSDGKTQGVTLSGDIRYMRAAEGPQTLMCIAQVVKRGHSVDFIETELYGENEKLLARISFMFARTAAND